jgi:2-polyprenyl-6-methoxyphenol hydroxylase-like FAD-dependent oxidoreductase
MNSLRRQNTLSSEGLQANRGDLMRSLGLRAAALGRVATLAFVSFASAELVLGASTISRGASLAPTLLFYGGGVVFIREFARRTGLGTVGVVILGLAYALLEEGLVMQTLFSPTLFSVAAYGGRALGVNWIWALWVLGYHAAYSVLIPIVLTEFLFDEQKDEPWLGFPGLVVAGLVWLLAGLVLGNYFRQHLLHGSAPLRLMLPTALLAAALALFAGPISRRLPHLRAPTKLPNPAVTGAVVLGVAYGWTRIAALPVELKPFPVAGVFLAVSLLMAAGIGLLLNAASRAFEWTTSHAAAATLGALAPNILVGAHLLQYSMAIDRTGQLGASAVIVAIGLKPLLTAARCRLKPSRASRRVLVIGAGVAGPVCAIFLKRAGYDVELFERYAEPVGDEGGGLMIAPNGMAILGRLGLAHPIREAGAVTRSMVFGDEFGAQIASIALTTPGREAPVTLARAALNSVLLTAVQAAGVPVHYGRPLASVATSAASVSAIFEDGTCATGDLIVGADGLHSAVRKSMFPEGQHDARYTGFTNIGGFSPPTAPDMIEDSAMRLFFGAKAFFAFAPIRDGARRRLMWWTSLAFPDEPGFQSLARRDPDALRQQLVARFSPLPAPLPELVAASEAVLRTGIYDLEPLPSWSAGRAVLIGDAAHAMPPHAGQGASMAMEDALVLIRCLQREPTIERAFDRYECARRPRVERIAAGARKNGMEKVPASASERRIRAKILRLISPLVGASIRSQFAVR